MGWNRHAHPNESSVGCVFCVPEVIFAEVSAVKSTRCPLCLPKLHAEVVHEEDAHADAKARRFEEERR